MLLFLSVLREADRPDFKKLRVKTMECAGLIGENCTHFHVVISLSAKLHLAIAVGPNFFRPDLNTLIELLIRIDT